MQGNSSFNAPPPDVNERASPDVRVRLTLALARTPGAGAPAGAVRSPQHPARYLTKNTQSTAYRTLPSPVDTESTEEARAALGKWERLNTQTELQLGTETSAPRENSGDRSDSEYDIVSLQNRSLPSTPLRGALVPVATQETRLSIYAPETTRVAVPFRVATVGTANSNMRRAAPRSTKLSRAQLYKRALHAAPRGAHANYAPSEATMEQYFALNVDDGDDGSAASDYSDSVFGSTAFSPDDWEEQRDLLLHESEERGNLMMHAQADFATAQQAFFKALVSLSVLKSERDKEESARKEQAALRIRKLESSFRAPAADGAPRTAPAARAANSTYWDSALTSSTRAIPLVYVPINVQAPVLLAARKEKAFLPVEEFAGIRCLSCTHVRISLNDDWYAAPAPTRLQMDATPPSPRTPSVVDPGERFWVQHHEEEDELSTCAVTITVREEGMATALLNHSLTPRPIADEQEYVPPSS